MKKISFLPAVVVALLVMAAPSAFANHCERCRATPPPFQCIPVPVLPGQTECFADEDSCWTSGIQCGPHSGGLTTVSLSTEYVVAAVKRLDGPGQPANETRVALLAATQPSH